MPSKKDLPDSPDSQEELESRKAEVAKIRNFKYEMDLVSPVEGQVCNKGDRITFAGSVKNKSRQNWPIVIGGTRCLNVGFEFLNKETGKKLYSGRAHLNGAVFESGSSQEFSTELLMLPQLQTGTYEVMIDLVYEGVGWIRKKDETAMRLTLEIASEYQVESIDTTIPAEDRRFWKQYLPEYNPNSPMGLQSPEFQVYDVVNPSGVQRVRSMLTSYELTLLYAFARNYTGEGEILDLGPLTGVTTNQFARGLLHNKRDISKYKRIYSFDLFLLERMAHFLDNADGGNIGSVFPVFLKLNQDFLDQIVPIPGDFLKMSWTGAPIELMFIDLSKHWTLNQHLLSKFFPHLIPNKSIIFQQDYVHVGEYWVSLTMEHLADYFEPLYMVFGGTSVYRLKKPIPQKLLDEDLEKLPLERLDGYFESAQKKASPTVREVLKCCQAANYIRHKEYDKAYDVIQSIDIHAREDHTDPTATFGSLIEPQTRVVNKWLFDACGKKVF